VERDSGATIFAYRVRDPERYGVVSFGANDEPLRLVEKPQRPESSYAVTGLYFYDSQVVGFAETLEPSARGELEITDLNRRYLERQQLHVEKLGRGFAWLDTGTIEALQQASEFIESVEQRQGLKICCPEEIAYHMGFIDAQALKALGEARQGSDYGRYLLSLVNQDRRS
jgi:glucose-1-phosphate thymidylyltransferase